MQQKSTTDRFYYYQAQAAWVGRILRRLRARAGNDNLVTGLNLELTQAEIDADLNYGRG